MAPETAVHPDPTRILFVGDTHGDTGWVHYVIEQAVEKDCEVIVQVGDFGYWEHSGRGGMYLDSVSKWLVEHDLPMVWIDGNHENHAVLRRNYGPVGDRYKPTVEGFWTIRPNLYYAPRGLRWTWRSVLFLALGGAYSIDKEYRSEGTSWWREETITEGEVIEAIGDGSLVDVMVTHDAPARAEGVIPENRTWDRKKDAFPDSLANRHRVQAVFDAVKPRLLVHGHYHHRNSTVLDGCRIEGLSRDGDPDALMVLDLDFGLPPSTPERLEQEDA